MKVISVDSLRMTERAVQGVGFLSLRALIKSDGMGFGFHKTIIPKGEPQHWHYKNHLEACYCISGFGILKDLETGKEYPISKDTLYVLDKNDNHTFEAKEDTILICIFNPPVNGTEIHRADGSYQD